MTIQILEPAKTDLIRGYEFYEGQQFGLGSYFMDALFSEIYPTLTAEEIINARKERIKTSTPAVCWLSCRYVVLNISKNNSLYFSNQ